MSKWCNCDNPVDCKYGKVGRGFDICRGVALLPNGKPMSDARVQKYRESWEHQLTHPLPGQQIIPAYGTGTELKKLLSWLEEADANDLESGYCKSCTGRAAQMDRLGPDWCEENVDEIVGWLKESHARMPQWKQVLFPFIPSVVRELIYLAARQARKAANEYPPRPFTLVGTRHLLYHVGALAGNDTWRKNIDQLRKRIWLFNGRRIVGIATGEGMVDPEEVKAAFGGEVDEFILNENHPELREVVNFIPLLSRVQQYTDGGTFYAHTKGVTYPAESSVHKWTEIMYETCLDYYPRVFKLLQYYPVAGAFKTVGTAFVGSPMTWHFAGAFFWFRNRDVFTRDWRTVERCMWGTESWPGILFRPDESGCIFHSSTVGAMNPFSADYLNNTVLPKLETWRENYKDELFTKDMAGGFAR